MTRNTFLALGLVFGFGTLAGGCAPANVEGTIADREFGKMKTAYFDTYTDAFDNKVPAIFLAQHKWTCEEIQAAAASDTELATDDPEEVVGEVYFTLQEYDDNDSVNPIGAATYQPFDFYDLSDYQNLSDGDKLSSFYAGFYTYSGSVADTYLGESGSIVIDSVDLTDSISGEFNIILDNGSALEGSFTAELCEISDDTE